MNNRTRLCSLSSASPSYPYFFFSLFLRLPLLAFLLQFLFGNTCFAANTSRYPLPDIRHTVWPLARFSSAQLECFTELDRRFISASRTYRLESSGRMSNGACLLRIPTGIRLTVTSIGATSPESYVLVIAGSSDLHMPLRTKHIRQEHSDRFGPWHVPCNRAYLVFRSKGPDGPDGEWIEFSMSPETEEDRLDGQREDCAADGRNFASVELNQ